MSVSTVSPLPMTTYSAEAGDLDVHPGWLSLVVFLDLSCIVTNLMLVLPILMDKTMRSQPSKWLLINCSVCILVNGLLTVSKIHHTLANITSWHQVSGLCEVLEILHMMKVYLTPIAVLQMTIERLVYFLQTSRQHSAFSSLITILYIAGGWAISLFFALMCAFIIGNIQYHDKGCYIAFLPVNVNFFFSIFLLCAFLILALTIAMFVIYFIKKMPAGDVWHIILFIGVSNSVYATYQIITYVAYLMAWIKRCKSCTGINYRVLFNIYYTYLFVVPICWLFSSRDIRHKFLGLCCQGASRIKMLRPGVIWFQRLRYPDDCVVLSEAMEREREFEAQ